MPTAWPIPVPPPMDPDPLINVWRGWICLCLQTAETQTQPGNSEYVVELGRVDRIWGNGNTRTGQVVIGTLTPSGGAG